MIRALLVLVTLSTIVPIGDARAESKADKLFNKGKQQLADKNYAEACVTFEEVDKLDPAVGAKLNVAKCYEEWGKLTKAYDWYIAAQKQAVDTKDKRIAKVKELVEAIDADVPRLTLKLPAKADPAAAKVTLDGAPFPPDQLGKEQKIDPGKHKVDYFVAGKPKTKSIELEKGAGTEIELPFDATATPAVGPTGPERPPIATKNHRKLYAYVVGGTGIVGLGIASVVTLTARSSYNKALTEFCGGAKDMCDDTGLARTTNARHRANIASVVSIVSVVAVGAGVVLYLTAPSRKEKRTAYVAPAVSDGGVAAVLGGSF